MSPNRPDVGVPDVRLPDVRIEVRFFDDLWPIQLHDLLRLRADVFVVEQEAWQENDIDGEDPKADHVLVYLTSEPEELVAAARLNPDRKPVKVSRIVVRRDLRGRGVGTKLMRFVQGRLGSTPSEMSAQAHLEAWYRRLGWTRVGPVYDEVGIPHVRMTWP